jgi:hypothetical protein
VATAPDGEGNATIGEAVAGEDAGRAGGGASATVVAATPTTQACLTVRYPQPTTTSDAVPADPLCLNVGWQWRGPRDRNRTGRTEE